LRAPLLVALALLALTTPFRADTPIHYRLSFPEAEHHWMQVEASFTGLTSAPLELRMSQSSPGRYSLHDFAKNVYDVHAFDPDGREVSLKRPDPYGWSAPAHGESVTVKYKVFGDRVDGTYLGIDTTHAHINMPAAIMWARGLDDRPSTLTLTPPASAGASWQVATQLHPGAAPLEFSAPNLQYLMDSPVEFGPIAMRQFTVDGRTFRFALHHTGTDAELDALVADVAKIVRVEGAVFGEYPAYEPGYYTFLADYLPYANGDGMEHRNSTVMTSGSSLRTGRDDILGTVAHEFFHGWNIERIRPQSLEPFDFDRANISAELWLGEGFTQYFGPLALSRSGLVNLSDTIAEMTALIDGVAANPARLVRSAEEMSQMAPFIDGGREVDRTNWSSTVISYYTFGGAIALALDLTLRDRSDGRVTLDDYMRLMWRVHGKPGGNREGYVDRPYTIADAEARLAEVSGDRAFARDFFARYVDGHEVADYARLLARAGLVVHKASPQAAWWGALRVGQSNGGVRVTTPPTFGSPAYVAGLDIGDEIRELDGARVTAPGDVAAALQRHRPGDTMTVVFVDRSATPRRAAVKLLEDPRVVVTAVETSGGSLTPAQRTFRADWLGPR
jgi:predicted metalloprotease with PDZ domain